MWWHAIHQSYSRSRTGEFDILNVLCNIDGSYKLLKTVRFLAHPAYISNAAECLNCQRNVLFTVFPLIEAPGLYENHPVYLLLILILNCNFFFFFELSDEIIMYLRDSRGCKLLREHTFLYIHTYIHTGTYYNRSRMKQRTKVLCSM